MFLVGIPDRVGDDGVVWIPDQVGDDGVIGIPGQAGDDGRDGYRKCSTCSDLVSGRDI